MTKWITRGRVALATAGLLLAVALTGATTPPARVPPPTRFKIVVFGSYAKDLMAFEAFARRAKDAGATHLVLTAEDMPWAMWQLDTPGDPYPAWVASNVGLLKIATPEALTPFLPRDYADRAMHILEERCRVLRKLGLKAAFTTFEPQMLPEKVYEDHPSWRGPQVDHPFRSRVPRFAPDVDHPEVLALYRESMRKLVLRCPEIEILSLHTADSGAGLSWSVGLYPGPNGSTLQGPRPMHRRYRDFFQALRDGAQDAGVNLLQIDVVRIKEEAELIALKLPPGMAVANFEGPSATRYRETVGFLLEYLNPSHPARGVPVAMQFLEELEQAHAGSAPRLFVLMGDRFNQDLYFRILRAYADTPTTDRLTRLQLLARVATGEAGSDGASDLVEVWTALHGVQQDLRLLNRGGFIPYLGSVQQRWLTRPFVPFPEELTDEEQAYYRPFLFQARTEQRAFDLGEMQGTYWFGRGGGRPYFVDSLFQRMLAQLRSARDAAGRLGERAPAEQRAEFVTLHTRLGVLECLVANCMNALDYQYYLDVSKGWDLRRTHEDVETMHTIQEWLLIRDVARREIDNTTALLALLDTGHADLIDLAPTPEDENPRTLGPDLRDHLRKKIQIMIRHWEDYERLFIKEGR